MRMPTIITAVLALAAASLSSAAPVLAGETVDFEPVAGFPQVPENVTLGQCSGVAVNSKGDVYLFHRGKNPILCFDSTGKFLRSWGEGLIGKAHGLRIDRHDNVWVTDVGKHTVHKFSPTGKLLLTLGESGSAGVGTSQFDQPTDIAFGPKGEIFVSDGYGNSRVMKFAADGRFLTTWGKPGTGRGEFNLPHTIVIDSEGRVLVGDRENNRVQIFDADGELLQIWTGFAPFGIEISKDGLLFVADGRANQVLQLDRSGKVVQSWGKKGEAPGEFDLPHMLATDVDGNLYVVEITGMRLQKLARKR